MGQTRAAAAVSLGAEIIGCLDIDRDAAERLAGRYPPAQPIGPDTPIDWSKVDRTFVCTPPCSRGPELDAVSAGVPVLLEKPVALSAYAADDLVRLAQVRGVTVAVGYMNRYRRAVRALKEALDTDPPFAIACHWVFGPYEKDWWLNPGLSGGPVNDQLTHLIDVCRFIAGDFVEVVALSVNGERRAEDAAAVAVAPRLRTGGCVT